MLWCQGAQNIGLSNRKLKSALQCTVWSQCTPVTDGQADGRTDRWTNIMAVARRFVLTNAALAKNEEDKTKSQPYHSHAWLVQSYWETGQYKCQTVFMLYAAKIATSDVTRGLKWSTCRSNQSRQTVTIFIILPVSCRWHLLYCCCCCCRNRHP